MLFLQYQVGRSFQKWLKKMSLYVIKAEIDLYILLYAVVKQFIHYLKEVCLVSLSLRNDFFK